MKFKSKEELAHYLLDEVVEPGMTFEERVRAAVLVSAYSKEVFRNR